MNKKQYYDGVFEPKYTNNYIKYKWTTIKRLILV